VSRRIQETPVGTVGMLVYDLSATGVVRNAFRIAEAGRATGLDVRLWPIRRQGELLHGVPDGVPVEPVIDGTSRRQRDLDSLFAVPAIARAIERRRPAILFSAGNHMHIHAALASRRARMRHSVRFIGRASNAVASAGAGLWRRLLRPFEFYQYSAMERIIAVSDELRASLEWTLGLPASKVGVIPNGVDVDAIRILTEEPVRHRFLDPGGPPVVLAAGRYARQKNFEGLIRAFALAQAEYPLRLVIIGPGEERRRKKLRQLAASLGIADRVAVEGYAVNPYAYMRRVHLFVLSSLWEGASNVLLEALACGCPVVATQVSTGIAEVLEEGEVGPLVPANDPRALAGAMLRRISEPRDEVTLVERARCCDLQRMLDAYANLFTEELGHSARLANAC
jgi:glycosyltransferase involved in cell wall biosynthesis